MVYVWAPIPTHHVGLSNILDREGREDVSGSSPMKRTHGTGVAQTLGGASCPPKSARE